MKALHEYMKVTSLNQVELSKRIGVNQSQLNHWLWSRRYPSAENLKLISQKTGISLDKLLADL